MFSHVLVGSIRQVDRDCEFLETERIMDYSLLVGIHFREISYSRESGTRTPTGELFFGIFFLNLHTAEVSTVH